jgi:hypothetical protein
MNKTLHSTTNALACFTLAGFALAGCGPNSTPTTTSPRAGTASPAADNAAGGGGEVAGGGAEAPGVRYVSTRFHYRVDAPGVMTEAADGSASAARGEERLAVTVVTGDSVKDLKAYATADMQKVQAASPKYQSVSSLKAITITGHASWRAVYTWTNGTNSVTGKPLNLTTVRYYISRDATTAAVLTYSIATSQYDPQGADDMAMTFAWQ